MGGESQIERELHLIVDGASSKGIALRAFGGLAVQVHCTQRTRLLASYQRSHRDIDLVARSSDLRVVLDYFRDIGYKDDPFFVRMSGGLRRNLSHPQKKVSVDLFFDKIRFCQVLDLRSRLELDYPTVSLADLLLTKMQRIDLQPEDIYDILVLLIDHDLGNNDDEVINIEYIAKLCSSKWRWWRTLKQNIGHLDALGDDREIVTGDVTSKLRMISEAIDLPCKSLGWKLRSLLGERLEWHDPVQQSP